MGVADAARSGDQRATLEALRDHLAVQIETATDRRLLHLAPLSKQLSDVLEKLAEMPNPNKKATALDELSQRRKAAGRPDATGGAGAEERPNRRG